MNLARFVVFLSKLCEVLSSVSTGTSVKANLSRVKWKSVPGVSLGAEDSFPIADSPGTPRSWLMNWSLELTQIGCLALKHSKPRIYPAVFYSISLVLLQSGAQCEVLILHFSPPSPWKWGGMSQISILVPLKHCQRWWWAGRNQWKSSAGENRGTKNREFCDNQPWRIIFEVTVLDGLEQKKNNKKKKTLKDEVLSVPESGTAELSCVTWLFLWLPGNPVYPHFSFLLSFKTTFELEALLSKKRIKVLKLFGELSCQLFCVAAWGGNVNKNITVVFKYILLIKIYI